ncbi:hypothetical protein H696_05477 [Fonticula alba]|uniref:RRM domain-containing protein n=1 Tax=Fonticula alba TaxID=691883 RepID=A0A058Z275_FONAL|nr:hypothetical protein H696_05477 [Fonticula alba]KCV68008.1 hypothetical protein H696_05477 [Fonticula alba]|eukprot:XP_009497575.1 hypothetical protein H696_05477 [Fonticula alba]
MISPDNDSMTVDQTAGEQPAKLHSVVRRGRGFNNNSKSTLDGDFDHIEEDTPDSASAPAKSTEGYTIILTNIHEETQTTDLRPVVAQFGQVLNISVPLCFRTGLAKGYAFVQYKDFEAAKTAIAVLNGTSDEPRELVLEVEVTADWAFVRGPARSGRQRK